MGVAAERRAAGADGGDGVRLADPTDPATGPPVPVARADVGRRRGRRHRRVLLRDLGGHPPKHRTRHLGEKGGSQALPVAREGGREGWGG